MQMRTHPVSSEELMAYLEGESALESRVETARHLETCKTCQNLAADIQSVGRRLGEWSADETELTMPKKVSEALDQRFAAPNRTWAWGGWLRPGAVVVLTAAALLLIVFLSRLQLPQQLVGTPVLKSMFIAAAPINKNAPSGNMAELMREEKRDSGVISGAGGGQALPPSPIVVRTAELNVTAANLDKARVEVDEIVKTFGGHIAQIDIFSPGVAGRSLNAQLRVPEAGLSAVIGELRKLGHVDSEGQRVEEVTQRSVDIEARLANYRHTELRLTEILRTRTGKLSDVLEVEEKLDQVRGKIEMVEAEQKVLNGQISLATIQLRLTEVYRQDLVGSDQLSWFSGFRNAGVNGLRTAARAVVSVIEGTLEFGPSLALAALILFLPARMLWRRKRAFTE